MAEEKNALPAAPKSWVYIGPGSDARKNEKVPIVSNLPLDTERPRDGNNPDKYLATQLPARYIPYVMETNENARNWWKFA